MKRIHFVKLLLVAVLATGSLNAWGADVTLTTADYTWSATNKEVSQTVDGITFHFSGGSTAPTYYSSDGLRTYEGCKITISSTNTITNIAFTYTVSNSGCLKDPTIGTWNNTSKTWTGSATSVGVTVGHSSGTKNGQVRITKIVVTYESSSSTETTYSVTFNAGTNGTCGTASLTETSQGSGVTLPSCTPNAGYTFVGWSTSSSATSADAGKAGALYKPTSNCMLYAVYSAAQNYTVTWVVGSNSSKTQSYTTQVASGSKATPPAELTLTGNEIGNCVDTFVGWSKSTLKNPTDTPPSDLFKDESPEAITGETTFYAVFATKQSGN